MRLAAIGGHYGCSLAELDNLTAEDVVFWHGAAAALREQASKEQ